MKKTLSTYEAADLLLADDNASWTRSGAFALIEYFEEMEEMDDDVETELDVVAIRCDFTEYDSLQDWADEYFGSGGPEETFGWTEESTEDDKDGTLKEYIQDRGQLVEFDGGVIVSAF
jgi:hypothetical protein